MMLHKISSFLDTTSLLVPYACGSIELTNCILSSSLALKAVLLIYSGNTLCFSLLNLCCDFNINLLLFIILLYCLYDFLEQYLRQDYFFSIGLFYFQLELLLNNIYNLQS